MLSVLGLILVASPPPPTPVPTPAPTARPVVVKRATGAPSGSLAEVAARTRLRTPQGGLTITNENLKALAGDVELTTAAGAAPLPAGTPEGPGPSRERAGGGEAAAQRLWQQRYQRARGYLRYLEQEEDRLSGEVERLKREFYAQDDPFRRDGEIKPAWDEALAKLNETRAQLAQARNLPDEVIQAALREGALPGWFRGLPEPAPVSSPPSLEAPASERPPARRREAY